jgi:hypothetical protein
MSGCWTSHKDFYIDYIDNPEKNISSQVKTGWDVPSRGSEFGASDSQWVNTKSTMKDLRMRTTGFSSTGRTLFVCHGPDGPPSNFIHLMHIQLDKIFLDFNMDLLDKNIPMRRGARLRRRSDLIMSDVDAKTLMRTRTKKANTNRNDFVGKNVRPRMMRTNTLRV